MSRRELTIVTGASRGIGKGIALSFANEKHDLMLFGRDIEALKKTQNEIKALGVDAEVFAGDVVDGEFVRSSISKILERYGKIDNLINNAGIGIMKKVVDSTLDEFRRQIDTNLYGIFNFSKAVLPSMIEKRSGSIINILSLAGKNPLAAGALYSASKHAALGFTRSLLQEVREYNIRVAAVCPGSVDTSFSSGRVQNPFKEKILKPEDIADTVLAIIKLPVRALISEVDLRPTNPK
jgi:3-oxoacyl-[acyl-carrier protein] reductase